MATDVKCPNCGHAFSIEEVMNEEYKQQLRSQMQQYTLQKELEFSKKLEDFSAKEDLQRIDFERRLVG
jgi:uncharacterized Zn finger protein (UPF0148 family)